MRRNFNNLFENILVLLINIIFVIIFYL